ncbi:MAG: hypothetical protein JOZ05_06630, partial [Acetobacteraceae bacterium]|nr:hypothetical protein [Acetobacteraceae bacterium]
MSTAKVSNRARAVVVAALLAGTALGGIAGVTIPGHAQDNTPPRAPIEPSGTVRPIPDFADLVAQVRPAVVSETVKQAGSPR